MATRSPGENKALLVMVLWISVSKRVVKQGLQSFWWFLGRIMRARASWQRAQGVEGMVKVASWKNICWMYRFTESLTSFVYVTVAHAPIDSAE